GISRATCLGRRQRHLRRRQMPHPSTSPQPSAYASTVEAPPLPNAPAAFHLLAKPTGAVCTLDCSYCFFLSKEMLYPGSRFRMAEDLLEIYLRQLIEAHARAPAGPVAWRG